MFAREGEPHTFGIAAAVRTGWAPERSRLHGSGLAHRNRIPLEPVRASKTAHLRRSGNLRPLRRVEVHEIEPSIWPDEGFRGIQRSLTAREVIDLLPIVEVLLTGVKTSPTGVDGEEFFVRRMSTSPSCVGSFATEDVARCCWLRWF